MNQKNMTDSKYIPADIEAKWQEKWESDKVFSPNIIDAKTPYFNLMMFPYPSAEGLHVGNMYAFTGADIYAKFQRMQGKDVLEPIGLDGFGIHSENYALKIGRHPLEQAQIAEKNFYRQMKSIGNSFDWQRTVETYNPNYYKWTQWLFIQLFKAGLAYRDTALVNWCPKDLTVLSDEQVLDGYCERCGTKVEKKSLEQWFFRITKYAGRLLKNIEGLDWSNKVKIAQTNWIGMSEGAEIRFQITDNSNYVLLHGFTGSSKNNFFPWLKSKLIQDNNLVWAEDMPGTNDPDINEQRDFVLKNVIFDSETVLLGHSLGSVVALKILEQLKSPIKKLVLAAGFIEPGFLDHKRIFEDKFDWKFDIEKIKANVSEIVILRDETDTAVPPERAEFIRSQLGGKIIDFKAQEEHITGNVEPIVLSHITNSIKVFTTRPDTLYGATFMVLSSEYPGLDEILKQVQDDEIKKEVDNYRNEAKSKSEIERTGEGKEKTGVFSGTYAINPVNGGKIPIWIADYVLAGYGTGAIMAVPAHDSRDFAFAKKYGLPIIEVIASDGKKSQGEKIAASASAPGNDGLTEVYTGSGKLINSSEWDGIEVPKNMGMVLESLEAKDWGKRKANFHLRDWLISRQRYWGPPIPMIFCSTCQKKGKAEVSGMEGWFSVPEAELPVLLPDVEDWKPEGTGKAPLANHPEFYKTTCPSCGGEAIRETDVSDTFLDSSWYFLRYPSTDIETKPFDKETTSKWLPVNMYIGGAEHAVLHLLYARFVTMALSDLGYLNFEEPFSTFFAHGLIIKDGAKMSKSKGNVVVPDEYISKYGADTLRTYLMFIGPYSDGGDFRDSGIEGMNKFLRKVWKMIAPKNELKNGDIDTYLKKLTLEITEEINNLRYNTAISRLMMYYNFLIEKENEGKEIYKEEIINFLKMFAVFAPHMTEELWEKLGYSELGTGFSSIHLSSWPQIDKEELQNSSTVTVAISVNGKTRATMDVAQTLIQKEAEEQAKKLVTKYLEGKDIKKVIYVKGKIINFVI